MPPRKKIPLQTKIDVLVEAGYRCGNPACGIVLTPDILEDHHIQSVAEGGGNEVSNLLALCPLCHALYTKKKISLDAIRHWKRMLVALNHAYSRESMDLLLFLVGNEWSGTCYTSDGVSKFAGLIVAGLVTAERHPLTPIRVLEGVFGDWSLGKATIQNMKDALEVDTEAMAARIEAKGISSKDGEPIIDWWTRSMEENPRLIEHWETKWEEMKNATDWYRPLLYQLRLTERGRMLAESWLTGDSSKYIQFLHNETLSTDDT